MLPLTDCLSADRPHPVVVRRSPRPRGEPEERRGGELERRDRGKTVVDDGNAVPVAGGGELEGGHGAAARRR